MKWDHIDIEFDPKTWANDGWYDQRGRKILYRPIILFGENKTELLIIQADELI